MWKIVVTAFVEVSVWQPGAAEGDNSPALIWAARMGQVTRTAPAFFVGVAQAGVSVWHSQPTNILERVGHGEGKPPNCPKISIQGSVLGNKCFSGEGAYDDGVNTWRILPGDLPTRGGPTFCYCVPSSGGKVMQLVQLSSCSLETSI